VPAPAGLPVPTAFTTAQPLSAVTRTLGWFHS
jgi:hypothetical protein